MTKAKGPQLIGFAQRSTYRCAHCGARPKICKVTGINYVRVPHVRGCPLGDLLRKLGVIPPQVQYGKAST